MQWNRSTTIGVAKTSCVFCHGNGMRLVRKEREVPCNCVFRAVFRACYNRFRECAAAGARAGTVSLELCNGRESRRTYSRKREEFIADFTLVSQRVLAEDEHKIFRYHFLLGADWRLCCRQMKIDRGTFFHYVYRVEQKLGRAFAELEPFPLFPLDEYFSGMIHRPVVALPARRDGRRPVVPKMSLPLSA